MLCLGYQSKWNGGTTCKFGDEKCRYTHKMCETQVEYNELKKRVADGKAGSSSEGEASAVKALKEYRAKFCFHGKSCTHKESGKCKKDHSKTTEQFKAETAAMKTAAAKSDGE